MNENSNKKEVLVKPYKLVHFCEFDKYASKSYCAIHNVDENLNLGDITQVNENDLEEFNFICGGSPCFPAGTMINTNKGFVNIENVKKGDLVLTHNNRYMRVDETGGEFNKEIYSMKVQGMLDIHATSYHPFYVKKTKHSEPEKIKMINIKKGYYLASQINTLSQDYDYLTNELCWILGRYVADGHIRHYKRNERLNSFQYGVVLSIGKNKLENVKSNIKTYKYSCYKHSKSTYRVVISNKELVEFIEENDFGTSAIKKKIPQLILNLPIEKLNSFIEGYMSGEGCEIKSSGLYSATTISKELAMTLCDAIQKVYKVGCRIYYNKTPDTHIIEGRVVKQNDTYIVRFTKDSERKHLWFLEDNKIWYPVKSIKSTDKFEDVYNIEVNEDHTYIADRVVCYNCQDFSVSGKQKGSVWTCNECGHEFNPLTVHHSKRDKCPHCNSENISKTRSSLLVEWLRMIKANKPNFGVYENVKNIVGRNFKDTFDMFIQELQEYGYNTYYKVLNACDYGVPQNRQRLYLIIIKKELDNGLFKFPEPFDNGVRMKDKLDDVVDDKYYVHNERTQILIEQLKEEGKLSSND